MNQNIKSLALSTTTIARLVAVTELPQAAGGSLLLTRINCTRFSGGFSCNGMC